MIYQRAIRPKVRARLRDADVYKNDIVDIVQYRRIFEIRRLLDVVIQFLQPFRRRRRQTAAETVIREC